MTDTQLSVLKRSLAAIQEWNANFLREYPLLKSAEKEDAFGNRAGGGFGSFQKKASENYAGLEHAPPLPPGARTVRMIGGVAGALTTAGIVISSVVLHGTTTPVAMLVGGALLSALGAVTGFALAPVVAIVVGTPIIGLAALAGMKSPKIPVLPEISVENIKSKLSALPGLLKGAFRKVSAAASKPAETSVAPQPPSPPAS